MAWTLKEKKKNCVVRLKHFDVNNAPKVQPQADCFCLLLFFLRLELGSTYLFLDIFNAMLVVVVIIV